MMTLLLASALAADPLWWTEANVSRSSALFGKAQSRDAQAFELAQSQLEAAKRAVGDLELGTAIEGSGQSDAYAEGLARQLSGQFLRLQRHADLLGEDYARVFGGALSTALSTVARGQTVTECKATSKVEMLMGKAPRCPGTDISAKLAASLDADPALDAAIREILTIDWPIIQVTGAAQPVVALTGTERSVDAALLARKLAQESLSALDDERDIAIEQLSDELDGDDREAKAAAVAKAAAARATWRAAVTKLGAKVKADTTKILSKHAKKGGPANVGLCANPAALGGCGVPDVTAEVLALIEAR